MPEGPQPFGLADLHNEVALTYVHLGQWALARQRIGLASQESADAPPRVRATTLLVGTQIGRKALDAPDAIEQLDQAALLLEGAAGRERHLIDLRRSALIDAQAGYELALSVHAAAIESQAYGIALHAEVCSGAAALRGGRVALAAGHARHMIETLSTCDPDGLYRVTVWHVAYQALQAAGDVSAPDVLRVGIEWVRGICERNVEDEYRDGFLRRNPVNAGLLAAGLREGLG